MLPFSEVAKYSMTYGGYDFLLKLGFLDSVVAS